MRDAFEIEGRAKTDYTYQGVAVSEVLKLFRGRLVKIYKDAEYGIIDLYEGRNFFELFAFFNNYEVVYSYNLRGWTFIKVKESEHA